MNVIGRFPTRELTVLAQDPSVTVGGEVATCKVVIPDESLVPGPRGSRVHVIDYDSTLGRYDPPPDGFAEDRYAKERRASIFEKDRRFHRQNVYGHVCATLAEFERALGRHVSWQFASGAHHIKVAPHAFVDPNAFYSREDEALVFGYFPSGGPRRRGENVYACLSADIVIHETTHALLDGLRKEFMRPSTPDQPAFHEGFADIVALLSALTRQDVLRTLLPHKIVRKRALINVSALKPENLRTSVFTDVAEQFGKKLAEQGVIARRSQALRESASLDPKEADYPSRLKGDAEPHALGEILVAAVMNAFLDIWYARSIKLASNLESGLADLDRAVEDGARAARDMLHMAIRAIDYMPPTNITFPDFLSALLTADHELFAGRGKYDYRSHIRKAFARYKIAPAADPEGEGQWEPPPPAAAERLNYNFAGHAEMMWDREAVMRFLWENREALELSPDAMTSVNFVKPSVRTGPDGFMLRETVVEYFQLLDLTVADFKSYKLPPPRDIPPDTAVRLLGGGTLVFDDYGRLKFHIGTGALSKKQTARVESMWRGGGMTASLRPIEQMHRRILGGA